MNQILPLAFLAALSLALAACGNKGPLVRPAPTPQAQPAPAPVQPSDLPPPPAPAEPADLPPPAQDAAPPAGDGNG